MFWRQVCGHFLDWWLMWKGPGHGEWHHPCAGGPVADKKEDWTNQEKQANQGAIFSHGICFTICLHVPGPSSCPGFCSWWATMVSWKKPFRRQVYFGLDAYDSNLNITPWSSGSSSWKSWSLPCETRRKHCRKSLGLCLLSRKHRRHYSAYQCFWASPCFQNLW